MEGLEEDLQAWIPRLVRLWRARRGGPARGPADRLGAEEAAEVGAALVQLQRGLTGGRSLVGRGYMDDVDKLGAYLCFYWPVSYTLARYALAVTNRPFGRVLDLGSGPGPFMAAAMDHARHQGIELHAVAAERSRAAARVATDLFKAAGRPLRVIPWDGEQGTPLPAGSWDLVGMSYVINELWAGAVDRLERRQRLVSELARSLSPNGLLLLLDPASLGPSRDLLALRDTMLASGHSVLAPCLCAGACPALEGAQGTCHTEVGWPLPPLVRFLALRAGLDKELLKMTWVALGAPDTVAAHPPDVWRVVSDPMVNKMGRTRFLLCGASGRLALSAQKGEGHPTEDLFFSLRRGDRLRFSGAERRENGFALTAATLLERWPEAGEQRKSVEVAEDEEPLPPWRKKPRRRDPSASSGSAGT